MNEEQKIILNLIEEGKITADEGVKLLEALNLSEENKKTRVEEAYDFHDAALHVADEIKEVVKQSGKLARETAKEARKAAKEARKMAREANKERRIKSKERERERKTFYPSEFIEEEFIREAEESAEKIKNTLLEQDWEDTLKETMDGVGSIFTSVLSGVEKALGFNFSTRTYSFEEVIEGSFPETGSSEFIHVQTTNGRIEIYGWDRPDFRLVLNKRIRASNEEEARAKIDSRVTVAQTEAGLIADAKSLKGINAGVNIVLLLPYDKIYDLTLDTRNGRINLEDLKAEGIEARTSNGRIVLLGVDAKVAHLNSSNGTIRSDGNIPLLTARTSNGSIGIVTSEEDMNSYDLATSNGSIKLTVLDCEDLAHNFDLTTSLGKIRVNLPGAIGGYQESVKSRLIDQTEDLENQEKILRLAAKTSNGNITINPFETF